MNDDLRGASADDASWMLRLSEQACLRHTALHPMYAQDIDVFRAKKLAEIESLITSDGAVTLVSERGGEMRGFLLAKLLNAPPVYDPGGPVCFVEEFAVEDGWEECGNSLVEEAARQVRERGGVLLRVVCSRGDAPKERFLSGAGFTRASEWYVGSTASVRAVPAPPGVIRPAEQGDVAAILHLGHRKRIQYETYQPVFWRKSSAAPETFASYMSKVLADATTTALVHERDGVLDGFVIATRGYIDDAVVTPGEAWDSVGVVLLSGVAMQAHAKGVEDFTIVCGHGDAAMHAAVASLGFRLVTDWYVRDL